MATQALNRTEFVSPIDEQKSPRLDEKQIGSLRHIGNLARQLPNDWAHMMGPSYLGGDFAAFRYQLAFMAYALGLAHFHRLPAAPGVFKQTFEKLIEKMMIPEVWYYWRDVSVGGGIFNHEAGLAEPQTDPIAKDNIMYSAYLQSMSLMYNVLFADDRYAQPGALTLKFNPLFYHPIEGYNFEYDQNSINERVYWNMVESGYLGVACEPNCVFQICNQPAILGFRMHDLVNGGSRAAEVTEAYQKAWAEFGRLDSKGHYNMMMAQDTRAVRENLGPSPWVDAWCGTLMNMWNREFVHEHYPSQIRDWLIESTDGAVSVRSAARPEIMGQKVVNDDSDFGWAATWASEMGDSSTLQGLLTHAERFMDPTWRNGGFYFPRNDMIEDAQGNRTLVEPMTGNVLLGYASLNVPDGLWKLYSEPWKPNHHSNPALVRVDDGIDVLQARFDEASRQLRFTLRPHAASGDLGSKVVIGRLSSHGSWILKCGNSIVARGVEGRVDLSSGSLEALATKEGVALSSPPECSSFVMQFESSSSSSVLGD